MSVELPESLLISAGERPLLGWPRDSFGLRPRGSGRKKASYVAKVAILAECIDRDRMLYQIHPRPFDFNPQFERFVSSALEMGVGPHLSGVISVVEVPILRAWAVLASYPGWEHSTLLWRAQQRPGFVEKNR